ncbi:MAG: beta-ketoacyl-[acyl-carrier-protein] synthase family protein [Bacteroidales bacterium]|nr:beta-ketoacyl-[acyl-carrier-protein] synthase family protein [Bacteroidales bacterium]
METRVLITGAGIISAVGNSKEEVLASLLSGRSGISSLKYTDAPGLDFPAGEVKMSDAGLADVLGISPGTLMNRTALLGIHALREAIGQAGISEEMLQEVHLISGTTVGGMEKTEKHFRDFRENGTYSDFFSVHDCGGTTELMAGYFSGFDSVTTLSTACSSAANAIIRGAELIRSGQADIVAAGGSECLSAFHINGFATLMILDGKPCRPFDVSRAGLNLGEGAAYLILESAESAERRGAVPLACLEGYANACDAFHQTASSKNGEGAFRAMSGALSVAGCRPEDVSYVNAHGTGTPDNDASESAALRRVFGDRLPEVSSTKAFTGHTTSACGAIESVICILAMQNGFIPANLNWTESGPDTVVPYSGNAGAHSACCRKVMCNSFGFGGNDSSLLFSACL